MVVSTWKRRICYFTNIGGKQMPQELYVLDSKTQIRYPIDSD